MSQSEAFSEQLQINRRSGREEASGVRLTRGWEISRHRLVSDDGKKLPASNNELLMKYQQIKYLTVDDDKKSDLLWKNVTFKLTARERADDDDDE